MDNKIFTKINEEVNHLRSHKQYTLHFKPKNILRLYQDNATEPHPNQLKIIDKIQKDLSNGYRKSIYLALKYLQFNHQLLQQNHHPQVIQKLMDRLANLQSVTTKNYYQEYIYSKLVCTYKQFLIKLASIRLQQCKEQYSPRQAKQDENLYCMYNLTIYSIQSFTKTIREFSRFFEKYYPSLNDYITLVGKDLAKLMKKIRLGYERQPQSTINFLEMQKIESQIMIFNQKGHLFTKSWIFPQTNAQSFELIEHAQVTQEQLRPSDICNRLEN